MSKLPQFTGNHLVTVLHRAGFEVFRIRGSHHFLRHEDGRSTVIPIHAGETIGPGLLSQILQDCKLSKEELWVLLQSK